MKFNVTMKDPDGVSESVKVAVEKSVKAIEGLSESEREKIIESRTEEVNEALSKWFSGGEYLTVEIDTEAETAVVVEE